MSIVSCNKRNIYQKFPVTQDQLNNRSRELNISDPTELMHT